MTGQHDFNEVVFDDAFVPDDHVLGEIDGAWKQATSELAYERSGPERFLETFYVLTELVRALGPKPDVRGAEGPRPAGGATAHLAAHVGVGRRHVAGRQGAGGRSPRSSRISAPSGNKNCPSACASSAPSSKTEIEQPRHARRTARLRLEGGAQAHHPGRHHRNPARHHRARAWPAVKGARSA